MARRDFHGYLRYLLGAVAVAGCAFTPSSSPAAAHAAAPAAGDGLVTQPASLVNPLIGTSGGVDEFPGPDMPFGMIQWSPDTYPSRPDGGGYEYQDTRITGYSLTHLSGPGCAAY